MSRNKKTTKIAALVALIAILGSVIWTWVLIIVETYFSKTKTENNLTQEQLNELLKNYSWSLSNSWVANLTNTGTLETLTWKTK